MTVGVDTTTLLQTAADQFAALDTSLWPDAAIADTFLELRREIDRLEYAAARLLADIDGRGIAYAGGAASAPAWAQWQAGQRIGEARQSLAAGKLRDVLPATHKAWADGTISASAARTICRGIKAGHETVYAAIEHDLVDAAVAREYRDLDAIIGYYRTYADALDDREPSDSNGVQLSEVGDRWALKGDLDHHGGNTLHKAIDAATDRPSEGDERTPTKRRADALVAVARFYLDHADLPTEGGEVPHVSVVITWRDLKDLPIPNINWDATNLSELLSRAERDQLLCDCNITRIILGPHSQPLDVGRAHRTAPRWLRRAITQRDRHCRYPGCDRPPNRCQIHHVITWWHDGPTALWNCILLCAFHHHVVHRPGWTNTFDGLNYTIHDQHHTHIQDPAAQYRHAHHTRIARDHAHQHHEHEAACRSGPAPP